jgi:hypothetical protein
MRRVAAGVGTSQRGFSSERPLYAHRSIGTAAGLRSEAGRVRPVALARHPAACRPAVESEGTFAAPETAPIWLAALMASQCHAVANGEASTIHWSCASGRALYTNCSAGTQLIRPLGVELPGGGTLAVSWAPGESAYTLEIFAGDMRRRA